MKEILKFAAVIAIVGGAAFGFVSLQERKGYGLKPGTPVPDFRLRALAGGTSDLASRRGRVVLVNFWATWCPPCVEEMPSLERLHRALGPEGLVVIGISVDADDNAVRDFVARAGVSFPMLRDPGAHTAAAYRTTGYPETFVIGRDGRLLRTFVGPAEWDTPEALGYFRGLLGGPRRAGGLMPRRAATDRSTSPVR
jgi:cytochrome c biogenesis protein CcmG, thiol:disulfide interchange protein DsbE